MRAPSASNLGVFRVALVWNRRLGTEERSKGFWDPQPFLVARDAAVNGVGWDWTVWAHGGGFPGVNIYIELLAQPPACVP